MFETVAPYLVAITAILISGASALTLIYTVSHFDPDESASLPKGTDQQVRV